MQKTVNWKEQFLNFIEFRKVVLQIFFCTRQWIFSALLCFDLREILDSKFISHYSLNSTIKNKIQWFIHKEFELTGNSLIFWEQNFSVLHFWRIWDYSKFYQVLFPPNDHYLPFSSNFIIINLLIIFVRLDLHYLWNFILDGLNILF